jgi:hypothetical protein
LTYDSDLLTVAEFLTDEHFCRIMCDSRLLSDEESKSVINRKKSAGHIYRHKVQNPDGLTTKEVLFNTFPNATQDLWNMMSKLQVPNFPKSGYLKSDEILPLEKIYKPRLFMADDAHLVAITARLFYNQNKQLYKHCFPRSFSALGYCKFYGGGERFYHTLPDIVLYADMTQQDSSNSLRASFNCAKIRYSCIHRDDRSREVLNVVTCLYASVNWCWVILPTGEVTLKWCGNISGWWDTTFHNTKDVIERTCYSILRKYGIQRGIELIEKLTLGVIGDDVIMDALLTSGEYSNYMLECGKLAKAHVVPKFESSFCSHIFVKCQDLAGCPHVVMALPEERIRAALNFGYKNLNEDLIWERLACLSIEAYPYPALWSQIRECLKFYQAPTNYMLSELQLNSLWFGYEGEVSFSADEAYALTYVKGTLMSN